MVLRPLFFSFFLLPWSASADDDPLPLEPVVVSATRVPAAADRLGSSVTVIDRDEIEARNVRFLGELLRQVPGVSVARSGGAGAQTQIRVRGAEANHVMVLIDGVEANDPALGDEFSFAHLLLSGVERVEIVRGPHSAIWGSDSLAGVINVVTRDGVDPRRLLHIEAGSHGTRQIGTSLAAPWQRGSWNLDVTHLQTDGTNISRSGTEDDGYENLTLTLGAEFDLTDRVAIASRLNVIDSENEFDNIDFIGTGLPADGTPYTDAQQLYWLTRARWSGWNGRVAQRAELRYGDTENANYDFGQRSSLTTSERVAVGYQASVDLSAGQALSRSLTLALEHESTDFRQRGTASPFGDPNQDRSLHVNSAVLEFLGDLDERLTLAASLRYDDNSDFDSRGAYRVSLSRRIGDGARVWGAYGTGQKAPTFIERFGFFTTGFIGNPDLRPEQSQGWEIGAETTFADRRGQASVAVYREDLEDEIDGFFFDPQSFNFTARNVAAESRRQGGEAQVGWRFAEHWNVDLTYAYLDSTQPGFDLRARDELRRPRHSGFLGLSYADPAGPLSVSVSASYNGERSDQFFPPFPRPSEQVALESYWLLDVACRYRINPSLELTLRGENLLDEDYEDVFGFANPGRSGFVGLQVTF